MVSIVATLLGGRVVATDLADHLEMLSININENISDYKTCFVKALEWGNFEDIIKIKTFGICDLILCSDLVYLPELYDRYTFSIKFKKYTNITSTKEEI